jgi:UDP:flavonoid glycosyltransferase YjiC (YdhE family)
MPVALAAQRRGHQVGIATGVSMGPLARDLGFDFVPCGRDTAVVRNLDEVLPPMAHQALADAPIVVRHLVAFSGGLGPAFAQDLLDRGPGWAPDVIVREPVEFGSVVAAERWRMPWVSVMWGIYINPRYLMREAFADLCTAHGLDPERVLDGFDRHLVIRYLPPRWQMPDAPEPPATASFHAPPFDRVGGQEPPAWLTALPERPTVAVSLGLSFSTAPALFRAIIEALEGLDVNGVVTVGTELDPNELGKVPANIRVERYVPGSLLLPHCQAVVFHGGFNSLHATLWHGLPAVVVPLEGGDQGFTAERLAELGAGCHVPGPVPSVEALRSAIDRVLSEPSYTIVARELQAEMLALPPLDEAVERMEMLVGHS